MEETINEKYLKGFNHAYLLAKHKPHLLKAILAKSNENEYVIGLSDGKKTFDKEQTQTRVNELRELKNKKNRDIDLER